MNNITKYVTQPVNENDCLVGTYVGVQYDDAGYIGFIEDISEEFGDYKVLFLKQEQQTTYKFTKEWCWMTPMDVLIILSPPEMICARPIKYKFLKKEIDSINKMILSKKNTRKK